jgi:hypothetical protein
LIYNNPVCKIIRKGKITMIALNILDIKNFMSKLLGGNAFDNFWLAEASITTYVTFTIDGNLHKEFFDSSLAESLGLEERDYTLWKEVKPFCFSVMRGKHTPLHFKIIFRLSPENTRKLLESRSLPYRLEDINGLFLNFQYDGRQLNCTTGTAVKIFTMDKSLDYAWDEMLKDFFKREGITVQSL